MTTDNESPAIANLVRDFLASDFGAVERDGFRVSESADKIWVHECRGIGVPEGDPNWSSHDYELIWHRDFDDVREWLGVDANGLE